MLHVALLGPLDLTADGARLELTGPKRRALMSFLALHQGTPVSVDRIVEALWPQRATGREESTLRVHISHLRDVVEAERQGPPRVVLTSGSAYLLAAEGVEVDVAAFERLTGEARALLPCDPETALQLLNDALALWRGRPLQDVEYEEFAQEAIRQLTSARTRALEDRAEALVELGEDRAAIEDLEALVHAWPTRERTARLLMRALYRTGRHADALRVARRHVRHLAEQGLDPSPGLRSLELRILQHDPALLPAGTVGPVELRAGRSVRGYELREEAGAGSVGVVFRAFQASVGREVALKAIHPRLAQHPEFVRRFADEARVVASLEHPHIVPLHDFWRDPTGAFLVMRWLDGGNLGQRLGRPWSDAELVGVFVQLAEALEFAHGAGIVHRDVKPANVLFDQVGNAYLADFGIAVTGVDLAFDTGRRRDTIEPPYASPEVLGGESPTVASDVYALGALLATTVRGGERGDHTTIAGPTGEVVRVATAADPTDRYPDMSAFRAALAEVSGEPATPVPRRVRRNPFKGLAPFDESDRADFYGRDDLVETLVGAVAAHGLTGLIGASGSGKSSVVFAGLLPELRDGALPGSDEWSIVSMVPGTDPFEEFHTALRSAAVGHANSVADDRSRELRDGFGAALDGPNSRALLIVDQFEEVFSSQVDRATCERFLDNLVDLAVDPSHRVRVVVTLRADFSERALAHPRLGDVLAKGSLVVAPMPPEQVEDVIRRPAARVGVQVEPGLVAEIVRDVAAASAYLPLLQYVLLELFERRSEDRLTVQAYREVGGVHGVLERRAEATFAALRPAAQDACRQLFLRMVHIGELGEETRRRLPLSELHGLERRGEVDEVLEAFSGVRLLTYDRDPATRTPTVEIAHETVIQRWTRYRVWIDEARSDLLGHRRLAAAASTWATADEDPSYLLTGGPLAAALEMASAGRIQLNASEDRYLSESRHAAEAARQRELEQEQERATLRERARRRLTVGIAVAALAGVIAVVAGLAWAQRERADELAAAEQRQNLARELAAAVPGRLSSADPELGLLLALEAAELSLAEGEEVLPEVVDALHRAVIHPKPALEIGGAGRAFGGQLIEFSADGSSLLMLTEEGGAAIVDPETGEERWRTDPGPAPDRTRPVVPGWGRGHGVDLHPDGRHLIVVHPEGVREWDWRSGELVRELASADGAVIRAAVYARDGSLVAVGRGDGTVDVWDRARSEVVAVFESRDGRGDVGVRRGAQAVVTLDFDPSGTRLASGGQDGRVLVWDLADGSHTVVSARPLPIVHLAWHPSLDAVAVATSGAEHFVVDPGTGQRQVTFGHSQNFSHALAFDGTGGILVAAGADGPGRIFSTAVGGEAVIVLPGGVPLRDVAVDPSDVLNPVVATLQVDGTVRIWRDLTRSELAGRMRPVLLPRLAATPDGTRYVFAAHQNWLEAGDLPPPMVEVVDAATGDTLVSRPTVVDWGKRRPAISPDGSLAAFAGFPDGGPPGDVEILDVDSGESRRIPGSRHWATSLGFSPDASLLAGGGTDGTIVVWDVATLQLVRTLRGHGDREAPNSSVRGELSRTLPDTLTLSVFGVGQTAARVDQVAFRPDRAAELASAGFDGTVRIWDVLTGEHRVLDTFDHEVFSLAYSPDGSVLAASDRIGTIRLLDADTGDAIADLESVPGASELVFSPDGRYVAGGGPGLVVHLWDTATHRIVRRFHGSVWMPSGVAFVNGGRELRAAGGIGTDRGYLVEASDLVELAREATTRDLIEEECQRYLRRSCDRS